MSEASLKIASCDLRLEEIIQNKGNRQVRATLIKNRWIRIFMLNLLV